MNVSRFDPMFTAEWMDRLLLEKQVLKPGAKWQLPSSARKMLVGLVAYKAWRHLNPLKRDRVETAASDDTGQYAAAALIENLEHRLKHNENILELLSRSPFDASQQVNRLAGLQADMARAIEVLTRLTPSLIPHTSEPLKSNWRDHATDLANDFIAQMKLYNERPPVGLSNQSPTCLYVSAVSPYITKERPSVDAVTEFLKKARAQLKSN